VRIGLVLGKLRYAGQARGRGISLGIFEGTL
jgi:hypothetical protein